MMMALLPEPIIRETQAFPKNQAGVDPMSGAPTEVPKLQLDELGLRVVSPEPRRG
jgi:aspartyl-tRNA synthetase